MMGIWFILFAVISIKFSKAVEVLPCHFFDSKNISGGGLQPNGDLIFEDVIYPKNQYATIDYTYNMLKYGKYIEKVDPYVRGCICNIKPCLRLCCPLGTYQTKENKTVICRDHDGAKNFVAEVVHENNETKLETLDEHFAYVEGHTCKSMYIENEFKVTHEGEIQLNDNFSVTHHDYCFHTRLNETTNEVDLAVLLCYNESEPGYYKIFASCMLISVVFFLATLLVYIFVPKLQNLQGKCLICYLFSLAVSYTIMALVQLNGHHYVSPYICTPIGFVMLYSFLSAFCWLNVLNFDLWLIFKSESKFKQLTERKQLIMYKLYGYGMPAIFTTLVFIIDFFIDLPDHLLPAIGRDSCFLTNSFLYFYLPLGILFLFNIGFFVMIAFRIQQIQKDLATESTLNSHSSLQNKREKYALFLRLFFVMGVAWSMEVISYLVDPKSPYFILTDICNTLQGLFIFILFVMNRRVIGLIKERWRNYGKTNPNENYLSGSATDTYIPLNQMSVAK